MELIRSHKYRKREESSLNKQRYHVFVDSKSYKAPVNGRLIDDDKKRTIHVVLYGPMCSQILGGWQ